MINQKSKNNNIWMKVLSVFIAVLIWIIVANTNDPVVSKRFSNVPVEIENEDALTDNGYAYEILEGDEVSFTIKGKKSVVSNMTLMDFNVVADFSKLSLTDAVPIDVVAKKYEDQLEISLGNVNTMKIKKDEIMSVSVPVNVSVSGQVAEGYYVGTMNATPNLIKVTGPKNLLSQAKEIRAEVNVDGIAKDITTSAKPVLYDKDGSVIESNQINMDAFNISVSVELWKTKKVEVKLDYEGEPASGYVITSFDYEPKTVLVAASEDVYEDLEYLELPMISLDNVDQNYEKDFSVSSDSFPDGVILAETLNSIKVRAKIEKITNRKIAFSKKDISIKNNSGYKVSFDAGNEYYVNVEGANSLVSDVTIEDFSPWIDLKNLEEGEHEVTVHVKEKDGIGINSISKIRITLTK